MLTKEQYLTMRDNPSYEALYQYWLDHPKAAKHLDKGFMGFKFNFLGWVDIHAQKKEQFNKEVLFTKVINHLDYKFGILEIQQKQSV